MNKKFTKLIAALALLVFMTPTLAGWGQTRDDLVLTFDLTSNPGGWPTTNSTTLTNYTYTLDGVDYTFALKNVKQNSGYLMLTQPAVLGLPAIEDYKLTQVIAYNSSGCSTSTKVGISSSADQANYIDGGAIQTWSTTSSSYTYNLTSTDANTMYYMYVTNKNAQVKELRLTYEETGGSSLLPSDLAITDAPVALSFDLYNNSSAQTVSYTTSSTGAVTVSGGTGYVTTSLNTSTKTVTVTPAAVTPSVQTITISQEADDTYAAGSKTFTVSVTDSSPLTNIAALTAKPSGSYPVSLTDALVTYTNGTNAYLEDASGAVLLYHCNDNDLNLAVGDKITGIANVTYTVYNNLPEVTAITLVEGYTKTTGNTVTPVEVTIATLESNYTSYLSRYVKIVEATVTSAFSNKNCTIEQSGTSIILRDQNSTATIATTKDDVVTVTAHPAIFNTTHQIAVYEQSQIVVVKIDPTITFNNGTVRVSKTLDLSTLFNSNSTGAVTYSIISGDSYATLSGSTLTGTSEGTVTVKAEQAESASYNAGEATATITVNPALVLNSIAITTAPTKTTYNEGETFDPTGMVVTATYTDNSTMAVTNYTYSPNGALTTSDTEITISYTESGVTKTATQAITVNEVIDYATLPFEWTGSSTNGSSSLTSMTGVTASGLGSDYAATNAPYRVKMDGAGDYIQVKTDSQPAKVFVDVKKIGGAMTSKIKIQQSANGTDFTDVEELTIGGSQNDVLYLETTTAFDASTRYVKIIKSVHGSNIGVGRIKITKASTDPSITLADASVAADADNCTMAITYQNMIISGTDDFTIQFCDAEGNVDNQPSWIIEATAAEENGNYMVSCVFDANTGDQRTAHLKVVAGGVTSNVATLTQAAYVIDFVELPFYWAGGAKSGLLGMTGVTANGLGTDYSDTHAPYLIKFDTDGDYIDVKTDCSPSKVIIKVKKIGGSDNSSITVKASSDGESFDTGENLTISGAQNAIVTLETTRSFAENVRYIRLYFNKAANVGVGLICIAKTATFTKQIDAHGSNENPSGWYLIASPVEVDITTNTMIAGDYDLYRFNESADKEWENYEAITINPNTQVAEPAHPDFTKLVIGRGYLYANNDNIELSFSGDYTGINTVTLSKTADADFSGWNLVGNPYGVNAYIDRSFYTMNSTGSQIITTAISGPIEPMQGIFVLATEDDETLTFSTTAPGKGANLALNVSSNRGSVIDRAIVSFDEGSTLPKLQLFENSTKVYIPQEGTDYAVISNEGQGALPVNFKATEDGTYTITVNPEGVEMNYLHLIDNMTGNDIDLLQTPSYSFNATTNDFESRFRLVFAAANNEDGASTGSAAFAFMSDGNWIISNAGEATLQVIDINGRILSSECVNGSVRKTINATPGVYMLRLINGENVMVQKIVVR